MAIRPERPLILFLGKLFREGVIIYKDDIVRSNGQINNPENHILHLCDERLDVRSREVMVVGPVRPDRVVPRRKCYEIIRDEVSTDPVTVVLKR